MSAEQMRVELELFVNKGLSEGLKGWPVKSTSRPEETSPHAHFSLPAAAALFHGITESPLAAASLELPWGQALVESDIRSFAKFSRKTRFGVTVDGMAPLSR